MEWHPDRNCDDRDRAEEVFKKIAEVTLSSLGLSYNFEISWQAYAILSDPEKRIAYSMHGSGSRGANLAQPRGRAYDIFSQFFGQDHSVREAQTVVVE
jgi:DnaJ-class molecular chaperone